MHMLYTYLKILPGISRPFRLLLVLCLSLWLAVSCLKEMPDSLPETIEWNPDLALPLGESSFGLNSVSGFDTTLLDPDSITGLPAWVDEVTVIMEGAIDFDLSSITTNLDQLNRILFRVNTYNGFPHEMFSQAYFRDPVMNTLDSMFNQGPLLTPPGAVGSDGALIEPGYERKDAIFDRQRLSGLENATILYFRAYFTVTAVDSLLIPYYPDFEFRVNMGAMLDLNLEF